MIAESAQLLKTRREKLFQSAQSAPDILDTLPEELTRVTDDYFVTRSAESPAAADLLKTNPFCILAQGGYGRGELNPGSDLDVLIIFPETIPEKAEAAARELFHPLWDLGLDLGHGVRDTNTCLELAGQDYQVLAALLDARFLGGDKAVFDDFLHRFQTETLPAFGMAFARKIIEEALGKDQSTDDGAPLLEPDLKNDSGGLRDCSRIKWLQALAPLLTDHEELFTEQDARDLRGAQHRLLRARTALHLIAGRKRDRLFLDLQPDIAQMLGHTGHKAEAAEEFLSGLHRAATRIKTMRRAAGRWFVPLSEPEDVELPASILPTRQGLCFADQTALSSRTVRDMFSAMAETGIPMHWNARKSVERYVRGETEFSTDKAVLDFLENVFLSAHARIAGAAMLETGFLGLVFPEFKAVQDLVQFDAYHLYPLGRHTVETLHKLAAFKAPDSDLHETCLRIQKKHLFSALFQAAFFHDIAKDGPDHAARGAKRAAVVLRRYGVSEADIETASFLIRHHLLIPVKSARIDLQSETEVGKVAEIIGTADRLDMLELLSTADAQATGPKAWNSWTQSLIRELCAKMRRILTQGPLAFPHTAHQLLTARDKIRACSRGEIDWAYVEKRLDTMDQRYLHSRPPAEVVRDLKLMLTMEEALDKERVRRPHNSGGRGLTTIETREAQPFGCRQVTVAAPNQPGLFAAVSGALCLHGMNVHAAEMFTFTDNTVLHIFTVSLPPDSADPDEVFARVGRSIHYALNGKLALGWRLEQLRTSPLVRHSKPSGKRPEITVDNDTNDFCTVLTVRADDRVGLLYDIAETLSSMFVQIRSAKIGTHIDRIEDIFLVRTDLGEKVTDREQIRELKRALSRLQSDSI